MSNGAKLLRDWRNRAGLTQRAASLRIGCTDQCVSDLECARRPPGLRLAVDIEAAAGIPPRAWLEPAGVDAEAA